MYIYIYIYILIHTERYPVVIHFCCTLLDRISYCPMNRIVEQVSPIATHIQIDWRFRSRNYMSSHPQCSTISPSCQTITLNQVESSCMRFGWDQCLGRISCQCYRFILLHTDWNVTALFGSTHSIESKALRAPCNWILRKATRSGEILPPSAGEGPWNVDRKFKRS